MTKNKQTPLTVEVFFQEVMPEIENMIDSKFDSKFDEKLERYHSDVNDYKVETIREIQKLSDEVVVTLHQYDRTNKRLDRVEKKLSLPPLDL